MGRAAPWSGEVASAMAQSGRGKPAHASRLSHRAPLHLVREQRAGVERGAGPFNAVTNVPSPSQWKGTNKAEVSSTWGKVLYLGYVEPSERLSVQRESGRASFRSLNRNKNFVHTQARSLFLFPKISDVFCAKKRAGHACIYAPQWLLVSRF